MAITSSEHYSINSTGSNRTYSKIDFTDYTATSKCPICGRGRWCGWKQDEKGSGLYIVRCHAQQSSSESFGKKDGCLLYYADSPQGPIKPRHQWPSNYNGNGSRLYLRNTATQAKNSQVAPATQANNHQDTDPPRADADTLNTIYAAILAKLHLSPDHEKKLLARGFDKATITANGYKSWPADGRQREAIARSIVNSHKTIDPNTIPGLVRKPRIDKKTEFPTGKKDWCLAGGAGIAIPVRDHQGRIVAIKIRADEPMPGGGKYYALSSKNYGGPKALQSIHVPLSLANKLQDARELRITEGELKADLATLFSGIPTISVPGVGEWRRAFNLIQQTYGEPPEGVNKLDHYPKIIVSFDADADTNKDVATHLRDFTEALFNKYIPWDLERWPLETAKGIDDVLLWLRDHPDEKSLTTGTGGGEAGDEASSEIDGDENEGSPHAAKPEIIRIPDVKARAITEKILQSAKAAADEKERRERREKLDAITADFAKRGMEIFANDKKTLTALNEIRLSDAILWAEFRDTLKKSGKTRDVERILNEKFGTIRENNRRSSNVYSIADGQPVNSHTESNNFTGPSNYLDESAAFALFKKYALVQAGGDVRIVDTTAINPMGRSLDKKNFLLKHEADTLVTLDHEGKRREEPAAAWWLKHSAMRRFENAEFDPAKPYSEKLQGHHFKNENGDLVFNLFSGFATKPCPVPLSDLSDDDKRGLSSFLDFMRQVICGGNQKIYEWLLAWTADIFQNPAKKSGVAVVLRSGQGTGKSFFAETIGAILGKMNFLTIAHPEALLSQYNEHLSTNILLFADESFWAGNRSGSGVLKDGISSETRAINPKHKCVYYVKNCSRYIFASNSDFVVPAEKDERRYLVLDVSGEHAKDHGYFSRLAKWRDSGGLEILLAYFLAIDSSGVNLRQAPETDGLLRQKLIAQPIEGIWYEILCDGRIFSDDEGWPTNEREQAAISKRHLREYLKFRASRTQHSKVSASETTMGMKMRELCPGVLECRRNVPDRLEKDDYRILKDRDTAGGFAFPVERKNERCYLFPSLEECRAEFEKAIGHEIEWPSVEGGDEHNGSDDPAAFCPDLFGASEIESAGTENTSDPSQARQRAGNLHPFRFKFKAQGESRENLQIDIDDEPESEFPMQADDTGNTQARHHTSDHDTSDPFDIYDDEDAGDGDSIDDETTENAPLDHGSGIDDHGFTFDPDEIEAERESYGEAAIY